MSSPRIGVTASAAALDQSSHGKQYPGASVQAAEVDNRPQWAGQNMPSRLNLYRLPVEAMAFGEGDEWAS